MIRGLLAGTDDVLHTQSDRDAHRRHGTREHKVPDPACLAHRRGGPLARTALTASAVVVRALFPQLMRSWPTISAISKSESCALHAGSAPARMANTNAHVATGAGVAARDGSQRSS